MASLSPWVYGGTAVVAVWLLLRRSTAWIYDVVILKMTRGWYAELIKRLPAGARVLDVGIGTGSALLCNADAVSGKKMRWIGLDLDQAYVTACDKALKASTFLRDCSSVAQADFYDANALAAIKKSLAKSSSDENFDAVYFSGSFSLLPDPAEALRIAKRLLKKGGRVYITQTFQHKSPPLFARLKPALKYLTTIDFGRLFFAHEVAAIVRDSGLELVAMEPIPGSVSNQWQTAFIVTCS